MSRVVREKRGGGHLEQVARDEEAMPLGNLGPRLGLELVLRVGRDDDLSVLEGRDGPKDNTSDQRRLTNAVRSEEHTSELQSLMRNSYAVFCLQKKKYSYSKI